MVTCSVIQRQFFDYIDFLNQNNALNSRKSQSVFVISRPNSCVRTAVLTADTVVEVLTFHKLGRIAWSARVPVSSASGLSIRILARRDGSDLLELFRNFISWVLPFFYSPRSWLSVDSRVWGVCIAVAGVVTANRRGPSLVQRAPVDPTAHVELAAE